MSLFQDIFDLIRGKKRLVTALSPKWEYKKLLKNYIKIAHNIKGKLDNNEKVRVGFVILSDSTNPFFLYLYRQFCHDPRFDPYMVVAPYMEQSSAYMKETTGRMVEMLEREGCKYISGYDLERHELADIKVFFEGGILFFQDPYDFITDRRFLFKTFIHSSLTYYIPYSYIITGIENCARMTPQKYAYKIFAETRLHLAMIKKYSPIKGVNLAEFVGYLGSQRLLEKKERVYDWKLPKIGMKKVILAPHHLLGCGNFMRFHQAYLDLARKYQDKVSFVLKPHPVLWETVKEYWTEEQINQWLNEWNGMPNTGLETGGYEELFYTSDAMIMDSASFCAEYSLLAKPLLFLEKNPPHKFNPVGQEILKHQYTGNSVNCMMEFMEKVVLGEQDEKKDGRIQFVKQNLAPPDGNIAASIYKRVLHDIDG